MQYISYDIFDKSNPVLLKLTWIPVTLKSESQKWALKEQVKVSLNQEWCDICLWPGVAAVYISG